MRGKIRAVCLRGGGGGGGGVDRLFSGAAKVLMSTEMSSVKSAPSSASSARSCFDPEISFRPTLIDRRRTDEGALQKLFCPGDTSIPLGEIAPNRQDKVPGCLGCAVPLTFLFVEIRESDNLSKRTSLILSIRSVLNKPSD